ncbi:DinB family protein [Nocardioides sp. TRM66260-LWL]|uniref:DinB family protein n=1 Tax=Nocardioides sp. TRM66260-LWL TaxID=2874478 RepID=UPI001CC539ED|nr:DinB family protein [Nocardioides sp. TRM66260-LWL]MBZ5736108.1 DinB family protein [Nocardioides sp. TRM66260-LWL]
MTSLAADEATLLRRFLAEQRAAVRERCAGLDAAALATAVPPSTMTLGGMLSHLAYVEDYWLGEVLLGRGPAPAWAEVDWRATPDHDWHVAAGQRPEALLAQYDAAVAGSDAILDEVLARPAGLGTSAARARRSDGERASLRWILLHLIEETARHAGHADLLREALDAGAAR